MNQHWHWTRRLWRLQLSLHVSRLRSHLPDRWVVRPVLIYDRKQVPSGTQLRALDLNDDR
jgi:hypothetical protein